MKPTFAIHRNVVLALAVLGLASIYAESAQNDAAWPTTKRPPAGELRLHPDNPRYFVDGTRPVVLLGRYHADFICSTFDHFTKDLPGYLSYLADDLHANFTQVWAIMIFSGRREAEYGVNTGGAQFMPFLRTGPGTNYYGEPKYDLTRFDPAYFAKFHEFLGRRARAAFTSRSRFLTFAGSSRAGPGMARLIRAGDHIRFIRATTSTASACRMTTRSVPIGFST